MIGVTRGGLEGVQRGSRAYRSDLAYQLYVLVQQLCGHPSELHIQRPSSPLVTLKRQRIPSISTGEFNSLPKDS
eukprot:104080-Prorocentrum_minimum.AAC.1